MLQRTAGGSETGMLYNAGGSTECGCRGSSEKAIAHFDTVCRQIEMRVHIYAAGEHVTAGRINYLRAGVVKVGPYVGDLAAIDQQVCLERIVCSRYGSVLYEDLFHH